jgi:hypothetical protein
MRLLTLGVVCAAQAVVCVSQAQTGDLALKIPPVKLSLNLQEQPVAITVWGTVSPAPAGIFHLAVTVDLAGFQDKLTPVLAAQLNRSDRCGERLSVEKAVLLPASPSGVLTASVHYERFGCAKVLGKEVVKRLVGGNAVIEVNLAPAVAENRIVLTAQTRKIDADGSLGDLLRSGSLGDSLRQKVSTSIESAIRKSADLKSALPAAIESVASIQSIHFADGGAGRLWLALAGEVRLSPEQFRALARQLPH